MSRTEVKIDFKIQRQFQFTWCWAAVGVSCALAYNPELKETQCTVVRKCLECDCHCCGDPNNDYHLRCNEFHDIEGCNAESSVSCEQMGFLVNDESQLGAFDVLEVSRGREIPVLSFKELTKEIDRGYLVAFLMENSIDSMTNHFVVVSGYCIDDGVEKVIVNDSFFGLWTLNYEQEFKLNYHQNTVASKAFLLKETLPARLPRISSSTLPANIRSIKNKLANQMDRIIVPERFSDNQYHMKSPYKVYRLDWKQLLEDNSLERAVEIEQRFFQKTSSNEVRSIKREDNPFAPRFAVELGEVVKEHKQRLDEIAPPLSGSKFEHRFIIIDHILVQAIWLRSKEPSNIEQDIFIPLKPSFHGLVSGEKYPQKEFLDLVLQAAQKLKKSGE